MSSTFPVQSKSLSITRILSPKRNGWLKNNITLAVKLDKMDHWATNPTPKMARMDDINKEKSSQFTPQINEIPMNATR